MRTCTNAELEHFPHLDWLDVAPKMQRGFCGAIERVMESQDGSQLSREECSQLANAEGDDLLGLLVAADLLRNELAGNIVTYVVNRNINFTNICFVGCKFCAFSRGPRESDTYFLTLEQMAQKAIEAWQLGATEVCIQGGLPHDLPKFHYRDILRAIKSAVPRMHIHAFSPMEFVHQNTLLFHQGLARTGPTLAEHLKVHALARLLLAGSINNLQVSWVKLNCQLSQLCLHAGANDYGGTLMEENISREAGATAGQYTSPEDFQSLILEAGRIPAERNTTYTRINLKLQPIEFVTEQPLEPEFA